LYLSLAPAFVGSQSPAGKPGDTKLFARRAVTGFHFHLNFYHEAEQMQNLAEGWSVQAY